MLASFLSRVMPALWTTTSTPPCFSFRWCAIRCGASLPVMSRVIQSPSSSFIRVCSSLAACGTSTPTTVAPSRCSTRAICSPMPRLAPVTSAILPASGLVRVGDLGRLRRAVRADPDDLAGDVGGLGGEQEAEGAGDRGLGALGDVDELDGAAAADLLAEAAGEALERALRDALGAVDLLGRGAEHDHVRAGLEAAHQRGEEVTQRDEVRGGLEAGGVEDQALVPRALLAAPASRRCRAGRGGPAATRPAGRCRRPGRCRRRAGRPRRSGRAWWGSEGPRFLTSSLPTGVCVKPW